MIQIQFHSIPFLHWLILCHPIDSVEHISIRFSIGDTFDPNLFVVAQVSPVFDSKEPNVVVEID
jgi:hypothetical protein